MSWQVWITISLVGNAFQTLIQRYFLKEKNSNPAIFLIISNLVATSLYLIFFSITKGPNFMDWRVWDYTPFLIISSLLYSAGALFWFNSLKLIEASEFIVLFTSRALWAILGAVIFLGESFSIVQLFGAVLVFIGVYLASWKTKKFSLGKGEIFALLGAPCFGFALIADGFALRHIDSSTYVPLNFLLTGIFVWMINYKLTPSIFKTFASKAFFKVGLMGAMSAITAFSYLTAYQVGRNAAQIATINQTSTIIIVIAGIIFLNEKDRMLKKILAAIISVVGVILIT